jgi:hypothetical protein
MRGRRCRRWSLPPLFALLQLVLKWDSDRPRDFAYIMIVTVAITTIVWLVVTG